MHDLIVVGGGIAGSCAALRAAQYGLRTAWILGDKKTAKASRSRWVRNLDNMAILSGSLVAEQAASWLEERFPEASAALRRQTHFHVGTRDLIEDTKGRIRADYPEMVEMVEARAEGARATEAGFAVSAAGLDVESRALVLATGVMDRQPLLPGPRDGEPRPHWIYPYANQETTLYCIRCEGHLTRDTPTGVIGHGEPAAQVALMLVERYGTPVTLLTHGESPSWSEKTARLLDLLGVRVRGGSILEVLGRPKEGALGGFRLDDGGEVRVKLALVALGLHRVYNDLARELGAEMEETTAPEEECHVLVDRRAETNVTNLFCVGDMATHRDGPILKQVYTAQEYAVRAVDVVDFRLRRAARRNLLEGPGRP